MRARIFLQLSIVALVYGVQRRETLIRKRSCIDSLSLRGGQIDQEVLPPTTVESTDHGVPATTPTTQQEDKASPAAPVAERSRTFLGLATSDLKSTVSARSARVGTTLKKQLELIQEKRANIQLPTTSELKEHSSTALKAVGPAVITAFGQFYQEGDLTLPGVYALALLGSCSGFHLFLYFITVGYSFGIMLPVLIGLYVYGGRPVQNLTALHSVLTVLWGIRSASFFLYREYVSWPQLHDKVVEVNQMARLSSKFFCWLIYSFFYAAMASPCLFRLKAQTRWGVFGKIALGLQGTGLLLESLADYQKSAFKSLPGNRNRWCNVGLFTFSAFPNYLGEIVFWYGTFLAGIATYEKPQQWTMATTGLLFISIVIRGAVSSLGAKQLRKYGGMAEYAEFRRTHTILGPNPFIKKKATASTAANTIVPPPADIVFEPNQQERP
jgi:steroid 5-alpha reductase family enzyme